MILGFVFAYFYASSGFLQMAEEGCGSVVCFLLLQNNAILSFAGIRLRVVK